MWICNKCGAKPEDSAKQCDACGATRPKPRRIRLKELEEVWTIEQQLEWERTLKHRKRVALILLVTFTLIAVFLYLFIFSVSMGWPRPHYFYNWGPSAKQLNSP